MSIKLPTIIIFLLVLLLPFSAVQADLASDLAGRILLQVERNGEAWYVNPNTLRAHFLGRPIDALNLMSKLGLGISNEDLSKLKGEGQKSEGLNEALSQDLAGKIVLQVEDQGQAWYINPVDLNRYYLGSPEDALRIFRVLGLGISEDNFSKLPLADDYITSDHLLGRVNYRFAYEQGEIKEFIERPLLDASLTRLEKNEAIVYKFRTQSPLSTDTYGYLGKGTYYHSLSNGLMSQKEFFLTDEYATNFKQAISDLIFNEMLVINSELKIYQREQGAYPVSQPGGDVIGIDGRNILTFPNGFFGNEYDQIFYHQLDLPLIPGNDYVYESDDGSSYQLRFFLPDKTSEGHVAGPYQMNPVGIFPDTQ